MGEDGGGRGFGRGHGSKTIGDGAGLGGTLNSLLDYASLNRRVALNWRSL